MSLLLEEPPLIILPQLAAKIGLNEAIILQQIYWLCRQETGGKIHEGKRWIWNSPEEWQKYFPFFAARTIRRTLETLRDMRLIHAEQIEGQSRPMFYRVSDAAPVLLKEGKMPNLSEDEKESSLAHIDKPLGQNGQPPLAKLANPYITESTTEREPALASSDEPTLEEFLIVTREQGVPDSFATNKFYAKQEHGFGKRWRAYANRVQCWYRDSLNTPSSHSGKSASAFSPPPPVRVTETSVERSLREFEERERKAVQ